jgi:hypothetical protein
MLRNPALGGYQEMNPKGCLREWKWISEEGKNEDENEMLNVYSFILSDIRAKDQSIYQILS